MTAAASASDATQPIAELRGVRKRYGGVTALAGVDVTVYPGRVHAIVGENGAGKSTLMKIMAGAERPDEGSIVMSGRSVRFDDVKQANDHGVAIVFQELSLYPDLDVLSNLFLQHEIRRGFLLDRAAMSRAARPVLEELGLELRLDCPVGRLRLGERQLVEIAKALLTDAFILILDEPNSALNAVESARLFEVARTLRARGVAILFISHRLEEVFQIADEITVIRNGRVAGTYPINETSVPHIISQMIGRRMAEVPRRGSVTVREGDALRLHHVTVEDHLDDVSLAASPGEIVGLAGLEGSGVTAVLEAIFGQRPVAQQAIELPGGHGAPGDIPEAVSRGVALVPADRREDGLMLDQDIRSNITQVTAGVQGRFGFWLKNERIEERAQVRSSDLGIVSPSTRAPARSLSGGNQQKVVIAKWLEADPRVVLLNDPTRGVDIGAKEDIYGIVEQLAADGRIVLFTSTELTEYVRLCDRVMLFYRGRICGELGREELSTERLLHAINTGVMDAGPREGRGDGD